MNTINKSSIVSFSKNISKFSSQQKLSLMLLNKHFNIHTFDIKLSRFYIKSLELHQIKVNKLPLFLRTTTVCSFFNIKDNINSLKFVKDFSLFFDLTYYSNSILSFFSNIFLIKNLSFIIWIKRFYSFFSLKNGKFFYFYTKALKTKNRFNVLNSFNVLLSYTIHKALFFYNFLFFTQNNLYEFFFRQISIKGKLSSYIFLFSYLKDLSNCTSPSSIFFRFYFAYRFNLIESGVLNVFSYKTIVENSCFWSAFNEDYLKQFNFTIDQGFLTFVRNWTVTNTLFFLEQNNKPCSHYLNYKYIINNNYSYVNFLNHLIGLLSKRGLRLKSFKVVFFLSLKVLNLKKEKSFYFSNSLSKIQPMFRVLKNKSRGKSKVIPQSLTASKLYSFSFTALVKHSRMRNENAILLKLFSEIIDISTYKGMSLKTKILNLKLFIQNKYNIVSSSTSMSSSSKRYRNKIIL